MVRVYVWRSIAWCLRGAAITLSLPLMLGVNVFAQRTIHVPADQPTIQAGVDSAVNGDTVLVAAGTYLERIDFKGKNIVVKSEAGAAATIIDGQLLGSVVTFENGEQTSAVLSGFTLQHGKAGSGAGIFISAASPTIEHNIIMNNGCGEGAGIKANFASPIIRFNSIHDNNTTSDCLSGGLGGGGILVAGSGSTQVLFNVIYNNKNGSEGGGVELWAAGSAIVKGNIIRNNVATNGGGMGMENEGTSIVSGNVIVANQGGGVYFGRSPAEFSNNTVAWNASSTNAELQGFLFLDGSRFRNNLFIATSGKTAIQCDTSAFYTIKPADFTYNDVFSAGGAKYTCTDQTGAGHNISADPLFANPVKGNFHLSTGSPAIDVADPATSPVPANDADGNPRPVAGISGGAALLDLGGYEYQGKTSFTVSLQSLDFSSQKVNTPSAAQPVTLTNTGAVALHLKQIQIGGDFQQTGDCETPDGLAPGKTCTLTVIFQPLSAGAKSETLSIAGANSDDSDSIALSGFGTAPVVQLSTNSLTFADQALFTTSAAQMVTVSNVGDAPLVISSIAVSGDFGQTNNCTTVAPGSSCVISVTFTPLFTRVRTGAVVVTDDAGGSPRQVSLSGSATGPEISFSVPTLLFLPQSIGTLSNPLQLTVTNTGGAVLVISGLQISGDFSQTNNCGVLPPAASCQVTVSFLPTVFGARTGAITFTDNAAASPQQVALTGQGTAPIFNLSASAPFPSAIALATTSKRLFFVGNAGNEPLIVSGVSISAGDFSQSNSCTVPLPPNTGCTITVTFAPTQAGSRTGTLTINHNAAGSPSVVSLSATALAGYPVPTLTSISPESLEIGGAPVTVQIRGTNFFPATIVSLDNHPLPVTQSTSTFISATIDSSFMTNYGEHLLTVTNPSPGGGSTAAVRITAYRAVPLSARSLVYDPYRRVYYASIAAGAFQHAQSVQRIDPVTGVLSTLATFTAEPSKLAISDDGQYLFVGMDSLHSIKRINLYSRQVDLEIPLGTSGFLGGYAAADIFPLPGKPHSIAVTLATYTITTPYQSVAIFDDATERPNHYDGGFPYAIAMASDPSLLYVASGGVSPGSLTALRISSAGLSFVNAQNTGTNGLESDGTSLFSFTVVIDPATLLVKNHFTFPGGQFNSVDSVSPERGTGRAYLTGRASDLGNQGYAIWRGNSNDFTVANDFVLLPVTGSFFISDLSRWGSDGVAFRAYSGSTNAGGSSNTDRVWLTRSATVRPVVPGATTPIISDFQPSAVLQGVGNMRLTIDGAGFVPGAVVKWNGSERTTEFVNSAKLIAYIPSGDLVTAGNTPITVENPGTPVSTVSNFPVLPTDTTFVEQEYRAILHRDADAAGLNFWVSQLANGAISRGDFVKALLTSSENVSHGRLVAQLYLAILLRDADFDGYGYWMSHLQNGMSAQDVANAFIGSAEFQQRYGSLSNTQFVTQLYNNILLRQPDSDGLSYWTGLLASGSMNRGQVALGFMQSQEFQTNPGIQNRVTAVLLFFDLLQRDGSAGEYQNLRNQLDGGTPLSAAIAAVLNSAEYVASASSSANNSAFVQQQYRDILGRAVDDNGLAFWASQLGSGATSRSDFIQALFNSSENMSHGRLVAQLYVAILLRDADYDGYGFWVRNLQNGMSTQAVANAFIGSTEFQLRYGNLNDTQFVTQLYNNILLRQPDSDGLAYWTGLLGSGAMSRGQVALGFMQSLEFQNSASIQNRVTATLLIFDFLQRDGSADEYQALRSQLNGGASLSSVIDAIMNSQDYLLRF